MSKLNEEIGRGMKHIDLEYTVNKVLESTKTTILNKHFRSPHRGIQLLSAEEKYPKQIEQLRDKLKEQYDPNEVDKLFAAYATHRNPDSTP